MTAVIINDILPLTQAIAVGSQTVYPTDWTANYASDVVVYSRPTNTPADDATQILSYPSQYSVAFIGDQDIVQVTLVTPSTAGDVVTITRQTPADRENLYTNTNFTPSMLNNDFGILTLVDQQAQLVNQQIAPRYNYSDFIDPIVDTILPVLTANQIWAKNSNDTAFIGITIGSAASAALTNPAYPYVASTNRGFTPGNFVTTNDTYGTLVDGGYVPGTVTQINTGTGLSGGPLTTTGTILFAPISANSFWANMTAGTAVPAVHSLGSFLLAANNLDDLTNVSAAVANLGLTIGTNTQAHSVLLDEIAAGTWAGAASITTLGTVGTGAWQGTDIAVGYGGTGTSSFTPYSIICAGITSTGHFQNVSGVGVLGAILTSQGPGLLPIWTTGSGSVTPATIQDQIWTYSADTGTANNYIATLTPPILATVPGTQVVLLVAHTNTGASTLSVNTFGPDAITDTSKNALVGGEMVAGMIALLQFDGTQFQLLNPIIAAAIGIVNPGLINQLGYYAASGSTISGLATGNSGVLITSSGGVPSISSTLPGAVQSNITALGTIATGVWQGTLIGSTYGGTGVSNPTAHGIMIGEGSSAMTSIVLTAGQILIGTTSSDPAAAAINSGTSVLVQNATGSITIGLATIAAGNILSNITAGTAAPIANTLTATIDAAIGSTQGDILYRNSSGWVVLAPGTATQFLQTGGASANPSWVTSPSASTAFFCGTAGHTNQTGDGTVYTAIFETNPAGQGINTGTSYSTTTGLFTAPVTGVYHFSTGVTISGATSSNNIELYFQMGGTNTNYYNFYNANASVVDSSLTAITGSITVKMTASDTIAVTMYATGATKVVGLAAGSYFSGFRVS